MKMSEYSKRVLTYLISSHYVLQCSQLLFQSPLLLFENNIRFPKGNQMQKLRVPFLLLLSFCFRNKF